MYCLCNPLTHLTGFSAFLILVFFSTSERALVFSHPVKGLLSFKNPFATWFLVVFFHLTLFLGFLFSHTECKLWKMRFFNSSPKKVRPIFLILLCGFHIVYFWHKKDVPVLSWKHSCLFRAFVWVEITLLKIWGCICWFADQKINLNHFLLWDEFFGYWLTSFITWSETIYVSINK